MKRRRHCAGRCGGAVPRESSRSEFNTTTIELIDIPMAAARLAKFQSIEKAAWRSGCNRPPRPDFAIPRCAAPAENASGRARGIADQNQTRARQGQSGAPAHRDGGRRRAGEPVRC